MHMYNTLLQRQRETGGGGFLCPSEISADWGVTWTTCTFPPSSPRESEQAQTLPLSSLQFVKTGSNWDCFTVKHSVLSQYLYRYLKTWGNKIRHILNIIIGGETASQKSVFSNHLLRRWACMYHLSSYLANFRQTYYKELVEAWLNVIEESQQEETNAGWDLEKSREVCCVLHNQTTW